jgi:AcrR family transcriptional regulator
MYCYIGFMSQVSNLQVSRPAYHHGDLRQTLLTASKQLIAEHGIEYLSLRKLAERVGVSRTAAYHHFDDKNDLLCAIAAEGFRQNIKNMQKNYTDEKLTDQQKVQQYIYQYVQFAAQNPEVYELMFGRCIWKQDKSTTQLKEIAYASFQYQLEMIKHWQSKGLIQDDDSLRISQVLWGAMHGIAKLYIDGIYTDVSRVEEISLMAVKLFVPSLNCEP